MARFLNEKQVSEMLGLRVKTLQRWRLENRGPEFRKLGGAVRYDAAALARWVESQPAGGDTVATGEAR